LREGIMRGSYRRTGIGIAILSLGLAACEGDNAFQPTREAPLIAELTVPLETAEGQRLTILARGEARVALDSLSIELEVGGLTLRQTKLGVRRETFVEGSFIFQLPAVLSDTLMVVRAVAVDAQRNVSTPELRTLIVRDNTPPTVSTALPATPASQGATLAFAVTGQDNMGLARLGIEILDPAGHRVLADSVGVAGRAATTTFTVTLPEMPTFGIHTVRAIAVDRAGNRGESSVLSLPVTFLDREDPEVAILEPSSTVALASGDPLTVRFRASDNDALALTRIVGLALRVDPATGEGEWIQRYVPTEVSHEAGMPSGPGAGQVAEHLRVLTFDTASLRTHPPLSEEESLAVVVTTEDRSGRVSADTMVLALLHDISRPSVRFTAPAQDSEVSHPDSIPILLSAEVSDAAGRLNTGIVSLTLTAVAVTQNAATGQNTVTSLLSQPIEFTPRDLGPDQLIVAPVPFSWPLTLSRDTPAPDRIFFVILTVRDLAGNVAADTLRLRSAQPSP
jgi:hypothetical protein